MSASTDFVSLNGDWLLHYGPQQCAAEGMPSPEIPEWFESCPAVVPGNVELDLIAAGVLPADLDRGDNIYSLIDYEHYQWWYVKDFDLPSHADFADPYLCLDGIDTLATIWLNKCLVGKTDNMLVPHRFPVLNQLRGSFVTQASRLSPAPCELSNSSASMTSHTSPQREASISLPRCRPDPFMENAAKLLASQRCQNMFTSSTK